MVACPLNLTLSLTLIKSTVFKSLLDKASSGKSYSILVRGVAHVVVAFSDILWSDPEEEKEGVAVFKPRGRSFVTNDVGIGCCSSSWDTHPVVGAWV